VGKDPNMNVFGAAIPQLSTDKVDIWRTSAPHAKFHVNRCNESPLQSKNNIFLTSE